MKITRELNLIDFKFWSGAKQHYFTYSELREIEVQLNELYFEESLTETQINDLFWFDEEILCDFIGLNYNEYQIR